MKRGYGVNLEAGRIQTQAMAPRWQPGRNRLRLRLHASLITLDISCLFAGFLVAGLIYDIDMAKDQWLLIFFVLAPIYLGAALNAHAYAVSVIQEPGRGVSRALQAFALAAAIVVLVAFYLKASANFSRLTFAVGSGFSIVFLGVARDQFLRRARRILGGNPFSVVLISDGDHAIPADGFSVFVSADACFDPDQAGPVMYDRLATTLKDADRVIVACAPERRLSWAKALKGANIQSEIIAPELLALAPLGMSHWGGSPTLIVADGPLSRFDSVAKRLFDIAVASIALVLLSPVLLIVAGLIKAESTGPIFFVQTRIGRGNGMFRMFKFRSMSEANSDSEGHASTARDDDRITRVGRFIRGTSIDELPQLLNVLSGHMSIVGPRPHAIGSRAEDKLFWEIDERYWHRHAAKPGLTGLAQVRGYRGATMFEQDLTDRLQADLEYLNDWTIWKDIKILLMTFRVLVHKNAF
jgi:exopolysaccharide biosynthesis polyprenyl glycosylphosphotransferase